VHRHKLGLVHRDVKPSNILLAHDGTAKLTDFGIAQLEQEGTERELGAAGHHPGDKLYKSPEQEREFGLLGPASDLYSLGLVLAEMLVGEPYKRLSDQDQSIEERSDIPTALSPVLMKSLAEKTEDRYRNAREMVTALETGLA